MARGGINPAKLDLIDPKLPCGLRQHRLLQLRGAPRRAAVGAHVDARDFSGPAPRDAVDLAPAARQRHRERRIGDERSRVHQEAEHARAAVGHRLGVLRRLLARHERTIGELDPAQPLDVRVAFPAGQEEPRRIALLGPDRFAVLSVGDQRIVERLGDGDAAREHGGVAALGEEPRRLRPRADFAEERRERHAGPFARAREAGDLLRRQISGRAAAAEVAGAFEEVHAAHGRESLEIGERENRRPLDHAVNQERVALWIDLGHAGMMPLEVEVGRRDRPAEILVRRAGRCRAARLPLRLFSRRALAERAARTAAHFRRIGRRIRRLRCGLRAERDDAGGACEEIAS